MFICSRLRGVMLASFALTGGRPIVVLLFLLFLSFLLQGCGPKTIEVLQEGLTSGKSIVVFRAPLTVTHWGREGGQDVTSDFTKALPAGGDYVATAVSPGTYYVRSVFIRTEDDLDLQGRDVFDSRFGSVRVVKTPEKEVTDELVEYPAVYRWYTTRNGRKERIMVRPPEREWVQRIRNIQSYHEMAYEFVKDGIQDHNTVGTLEVKPGEVLLVPGVWAHMRLAGNACRLLGREEDPSLWQGLPDGYGFYRPRLAASMRRGDFDAWIWECPVDVLEIVIPPVNLADFQQHADPDDFPPGVLARVATREFVPGTLLAEPHEEVTDRTGAVHHIFSGRKQ